MKKIGSRHRWLKMIFSLFLVTVMAVGVGASPKVANAEDTSENSETIRNLQNGSFEDDQTFTSNYLQPD
ncbi:MAG: hypothetical protein ACI39F_04295, partial [Acutalibacteraceae bacterium]